MGWIMLFTQALSSRHLRANDNTLEIHFYPYAAAGQFGHPKMMQNILEMTETLAHG